MQTEEETKIVDFTKLRAESPQADQALAQLSNELGVEMMGQVNMAKYKPIFKNVSKDQLIQLVTTSMLLSEKDVDFIEYLIEEQQADQARIDLTFNIAFTEEVEYLEKEIAELKLQGESQDLTELQERLAVLRVIESKTQLA
jgi:hypothetical protein